MNKFAGFDSLIRLFLNAKEYGKPAPLYPRALDKPSNHYAKAIRAAKKAKARRKNKCLR